MTPDHLDPWLETLDRHLRAGRARRSAVRDELRDHILSQVEERVEHGESYEDAVRSVIAEFGETADLARRLNQIGERRRLIMRSALAASIVIAVTLATSFLMPPQDGNPLAPGGIHAHQIGGAVPVLRSVIVADAADPATQTLEEKMRSTIVDIKFDEIPLADALEFCREMAGINMIVKWADLEARGIERQRPVTLRLDRVPLDRALRFILETATDASSVNLESVARDGVLVVTSGDSASRQVESRLYDCADLLQYTGDPVDLVRKVEPILKNYTPHTSWERLIAELADAITKQPTQELIQVIQSTVDPDSWRTAGGNIGAITHFDRVLVIVQTPPNHERIDRLIQKLAQLRHERLEAPPAADTPTQPEGAK